LDSKEAAAYLETAEEQLKDAELVFKKGRYVLCAFLSASSAENAISALIIDLGAKPSKKHRNSLVLNKLAPSLSPALQPLLRKMIESLKTLEPHITKARYPVRKGLELLPPTKVYTKENAENALARAREVLKDVKPIAMTGAEPP